MASDIATKRKKFMEVLINTMDRLDPTGTNSQTYKDQLDKMSDKEFDKWAREFFKDEKSNFYLEVVEYERDITYEKIEEAAKYLKMPLYETVYIPYINRDPDNVVVTPQPVPVGYIHEKRLQQTVHKKNAGSTNIKIRNPKSGQVINEDKNARNTDVETYAMISIGANKALAEFLGPRADDTLARNEMYAKIAEDGFVSLEDLTSKPENKTSLITLETYFLMQGFKTNLVTKGDLIISPKTHK